VTDIHSHLSFLEHTSLFLEHEYTVGLWNEQRYTYTVSLTDGQHSHARNSQGRMDVCKEKD